MTHQCCYCVLLEEIRTAQALFGGVSFFRGLNPDSAVHQDSSDVENRLMRQEKAGKQSFFQWSPVQEMNIKLMVK